MGIAENVAKARELGDVQKTYLWELQVDLPLQLTEHSSDDLLVRCRNVILPGRTITPIETYFMGVKMFHPGKTEYAGTFTTNIEEYEDQKIHNILNDWMELITNYDTGEAGLRDDVVSPVTLFMYKNNDVLMPKAIKYINAWPQSVGDVTMDYTAAEPVRYDVTWQYDYWRSVSSANAGT